MNEVSFMRMLQWTPTLSTGHPVIDDEHRQIISAVNALEVAIKEGRSGQQLLQTLQFLDSYTRSHFAREEAYMLEVACPSQRENCAAHKALIEKLDRWKLDFGQGENTALLLEIYRELQAWIRLHIMSVDCKLRGCRLATPTPKSSV